MNLLYVSEFYHPRVGGGENWLKQLAEDMVAKGHTVHVVTSRLPDTKEQEIINGVHVHRPYQTGGLAARIGFIRKLTPYLETLIRKEQIHVIQSNAYVPTPAACMAGHAAKIPVITSVHLGLGRAWFSVTNPFSALFNMLFEDLTIRLFHHDLVHVTAQATKERFKRKTKAPVAIIYNYLEPEVFAKGYRKAHPAQVRKQYNVKGKFLLSVGSLLPVKNLRTAVQWVHAQDEPVTFLIAGSGPEKEALELLSKGKHDVRLIGKVEEEQKLALLASCDAFVLVSKSEQFPLTVLEALAFDRDVIATPVGGIPDVAQAGFANRLALVETQEEFATAVKNLKHRAPTLNKKLFEVYSREKVVEDFLRVYASVTGLPHQLPHAKGHRAKKPTASKKARAPRARR